MAAVACMGVQTWVVPLLLLSEVVVATSPSGAAKLGRSRRPGDLRACRHTPASFAQAATAARQGRSNLRVLHLRCVSRAVLRLASALGFLCCGACMLPLVRVLDLTHGQQAYWLLLLVCKTSGL